MSVATETEDRTRQIYALMDDLPFPLLMVTKDLIVLRGNSAAEEWLGKSLKRMQQNGLDNALEDVSPIKELVDRSLETSMTLVQPSVILNTTAYGVKSAKVTVFPCDGEFGVVLESQTVAPVETQSGDNSNPVSSLGRMLAHEIKNPLAGIRGAAQLMSGEIHTEEGKELTALIIQEVSRIERLVNRMEDFGEMGAEPFQPINIHEILHRVQLLAASSSDGTIKFTQNFDPTLPEISGDTDSLIQALLNLVMNAMEAIHHSGQGGAIHISTHYRPGVARPSPNDPSYHRSLPIEIRVRDDGPGIKDSMKSRIFQPFVTNKPAGGGLGLALVSRIVAAHNGLVEVQSQPGQTDFSILLPSIEDKGDHDVS